MMAATAFSASWGVSTLVGGIALFRILAFATLALLVYSAFLNKGRINKIANVEISLALLWFWCVLSFFWSHNTNLSDSQIYSTSLTAFLLFVATLRLSITPTYWKLIGLFYVLGCVVASVIVMTNAASFFAGGEGDDRATVGELNANYIAYAIATSIPMGLTLLNYEPQRLVKLTVVLYIPLAISAILLTGSRGALVAGSAAALLYFSLSIRRQLLPSITSIALACAGLYFFYDYLPDSVRDRFEVFFATFSQSGGAVDLTGREYVWPLARQLFTENLFSGIGFGAFPALNGDGISAHNVFLTMAAETGLPGLVLFSFTVSAIFWHVIFKSPNPEVRKGGLLLLVTWLPIAMTGVWEASAVAWMAFGWYFGASKHLYEPPKQQDGKRQRRLRIQW